MKDNLAHGFSRMIRIKNITTELTENTEENLNLANRVRLLTDGYEQRISFY